MLNKALYIVFFMLWLLFAATLPAMENPAAKNREVARGGSGAPQELIIAMNGYNAGWYAAKTGWSGYDFF